MHTELGGCSIHWQEWGSGEQTVVMLHHGLGSAGQWRDLPAAIADRSDARVIAYDRPGHGQSRPSPVGAWPADWLFREAERFAGLLDYWECHRPLLLGHSDGGSIALIHAMQHPDRARGIVSVAAHSWVEQKCVEGIAAVSLDRAGLVEGLGRYHLEPGALFDAWSGVWLSAEFRDFDIRPDLGAISARTIVIQGTEDEYGTDAMAWDTATAIGPSVDVRLIEGAGHLLPTQRPDVVLDATIGLLEVTQV